MMHDALLKKDGEMHQRGTKRDNGTKEAPSCYWIDHRGNSVSNITINKKHQQTANALPAKSMHTQTFNAGDDGIQWHNRTLSVLNHPSTA
jgi:hypothetical protein